MDPGSIFTEIIWLVSLAFIFFYFILFLNFTKLY